MLLFLKNRGRSEGGARSRQRYRGTCQRLPRFLEHLPACDDGSEACCASGTPVPCSMPFSRDSPCSIPKWRLAPRDSVVTIKKCSVSFGRPPAEPQCCCSDRQLRSASSPARLTILHSFGFTDLTGDCNLFTKPLHPYQLLQKQGKPCAWQLWRSLEFCGCGRLYFQGFFVLLEDQRETELPFSAYLYALSGVQVSITLLKRGVFIRGFDCVKYS